MITLDANLCIDELTRAHPRLIDILVRLGFRDVANPVTRATVGKIVTLKMGVGIKRMDPNRIRSELLQEGYEVVNLV